MVAAEAARFNLGQGAAVSPGPVGLPLVLAQSGEGVDARFNRIEAQMRNLTGQVEELTFQLRQLQEQLKRAQEDNEFRFRGLEGGGSAGSAEAAPTAPPPANTAPATAAVPTLPPPAQPDSIGGQPSPTGWPSSSKCMALCVCSWPSS